MTWKCASSDRKAPSFIALTRQHQRGWLPPPHPKKFVVSAKEQYEALHPETKHGANQHSKRDGQAVQHSFASDQAENAW